MTAKAKSNAARPRSMSFGTFVGGFMCMFALGAVLKNSEAAVEYARSGLGLCATSVIPSLFPFMVISELLVSVGFGEWIGGLLRRPVSRLFGISGSGASAVLLGALCGFPVGAKTAVSLYDRGALSKKETERLLAFCNIPSSGFLISVVGVSMFADRRFGFYLYASALLSSLLMGIAFRKKRKSESVFTKGAPVLSFHGGVGNFTSAVSSATSAMLSVCSYVIFFSAVIGCLSRVPGASSLPPPAKALAFGLLELSSGANAASTVGSAVGMALCGFGVGWSGLSVHFQILSLCGGRGLSFAPYFISKLCQGLLCAAAAFVYGHFLSDQATSITNVGAVAMTEMPLYSITVCILFLLCIVHRYRNFKLY